MLDTPKKIDIILAFDYGTKKIGTAFGQKSTQSIIPLNTIKNNSAIIESIKTLTQRWNPDCFVIGLPLDPIRRNTLVIAQIHKFIQKLVTEMNLPIFTIDETLSTVDAKREIFDKYGYKGFKKVPIDSIAATIILEHWIKYHHTN